MLAAWQHDVAGMEKFCKAAAQLCSVFVWAREAHKTNSNQIEFLALIISQSGRVCVLCCSCFFHTAIVWVYLLFHLLKRYLLSFFYSFSYTLGYSLSIEPGHWKWVLRRTAHTSLLAIFIRSPFLLIHWKHRKRRDDIVQSSQLHERIYTINRARLYKWLLLPFE